jgi:hypothetical protein
VHCKHLSHAFVWDILRRQKEAGMSEPIVNFLCSHVTAEMHKVQANKTIVAEEAHVQDEAQDATYYNGNEEDADIDSEDENCSAHFTSCMCCYYWVSRREKQQIVPLPMQNLLWFVRTLRGCEKKKCDSRLLLRLVKTVTEAGNMYAQFFEAYELCGMLKIKEKAQNALEPVITQGENSFCVKRQLAAIWHSNNGESILIPHAHEADLLR